MTPAESRVRASFARQRLMQTIRAELVRVAPGEVEIAAPFDEALTQQHGYLHAAVVTALADSACGYAALSQMAPDREVLSVEFKINLVAPAAGARFVAVGRTLRAGRTLTVCAADVHGEGPDGRTLVAVLQATMIAVPAAPPPG